MYTRILIPIDGSSLAEQVLPYGRFLARALALPVHLLKVIKARDSGSPTGRSKGPIDGFSLHSLARSQAYLETTAQSFPGAQVICSVDAGIPPEVIVRRASSDQSTLIVMATLALQAFDDGFWAVSLISFFNNQQTTCS